MTTSPATPPGRASAALGLALRVLINLLAVVALVATLITGANVYRALSARGAALAAGVAASQAVGSARCVPRADWTSYVVADGDTLESIAARFNASVIVLTVGNCLGDSALKSGQIIAVPKAEITPAQP